MKNNPPLAGVDLGSNSFRLLIAYPTGTTFFPLVKELRTVRLAEGLSKNREIGAPAMRRGQEALREFRDLLDCHRPLRIRACGTAALRRAANRAEFCQAAAEILACPIEVVSGPQEAALSLAGVVHGFPTPPTAPAFVIDVGGGSTECIAVPELAELGQIAGTNAVSLPLGAVNLTETYLAHPSPPTLAELALHVRALLGQALPPPIRRPATLIGTGGTATALAALDLNLKKYDDTLVHGHILTKTRLQKLLAALTPLSASERNLLPGLDRGRGEIVLAGAILYLELLGHFAATELLVSDSGLLEGIWWSAIGDHLPPSGSGVHI